MKIKQTINIRKVHKPNQEASYVLEEFRSGEWRLIFSKVNRNEAEGYTKGLADGLRFFDTLEEQTIVNISGDWPELN